jgi:hypothetical protein
MPEDKKTSRTDAGGFLVFCISRKQQICRNATGWAKKTLRKLRGGIIPFPCRKPQISAILSVVSFCGISTALTPFVESEVFI